MGFSGWYHLDFKVIRRETKKAFQVVGEDDKIYWLPKKVVADAGYYKGGDRNGTISVQDWFVEKEYGIPPQP